MPFTGRGRKAKRDKAAAPEPGQISLEGTRLQSPRLNFKIPASPHTIFLGLGPGSRSAEVGHYFPGATTQFWNFLYESGMWPEPITAERDDEILGDGFGLADVSRRPTKGAVHLTKSAYSEARRIVRELIAAHHPRVLAFVGKESYAVFLRTPTHRLEHGPQPDFEGCRVYLLPTPSNRNQSIPRKAKLEHYRALAEIVKQVRRG